MTRIFFDVLELNLGITVVIFILGILSGKLRKRYGAGCMKWLWMLLAVRLLIPYNFSQPNTELRLFDSPDFAQEENQDRPGELGIDEKSDGLFHEGTDTQTVTANPKPPVTADDGASGSEAHSLLAVGDQFNIATPGGQVLENVTGNPDAGETQPVHIETEEQLKQRGAVSVLFASLWLIGLCASGLYHVVCRCCFFLDCRRHLQAVPGEETRRKITALQRKLIGRVLPVFTGKRVTSPMLIGVVHPKMVFPISMDQWKDEELELIVAHELTHYQNRDILLKWILTAVCCVNWFNPAVHWMRRQCFYEMELACDGKVLAERKDDERQLYARLMLSFAGSSAGAVSYATGFSGSKKRMRNRIDYVLGSQRKRKGTLLIALTLTAVLFLTSLVSCGYQPEETGEVPSSAVVDGEPGSIPVSQGHATEEQGGEYGKSEAEITVPGTRVDELDIDGQQYLSQIEKQVTVPETDICYAMYVADAALGSRLYGLLKSADGGANWSVHSTNPFQDASGGSVEFTFLDESFGFAALSHNGGDEATLYVTEDGGLSYCLVSMFGNPKVTLTDGTQYEPYDYPQMPYYAQDQLVLLVGQGADGDYDGGDRNKLARFISVDHGKSFVFLDYVTGAGKSVSAEKFSFAGTVFTYEDLIYDISDRVPGVNAILSCTKAGKHIVIDGHIGPKNGAYLLFNTETRQFEDEIFGSNFIWYDDDITTAVYAFWNEIHRYDGSLVGTVDMTEGSYLYCLEFTENHSKVKATIMTESGDTEEQIFDL